MEVQGCAIDDVIRTEHPGSLVKIDVEDHELQAIRGMARMLNKDAPCVVFEQHAGDFRGGTSAVIEALRGLGYLSFFSVERAPSSRAGGLLTQVWSNLKAVCGGFRMEAVELHKFEPGFYEMIIAVHPDVEQAAADAR